MAGVVCEVVSVATIIAEDCRGSCSSSCTHHHPVCTQIYVNLTREYQNYTLPLLAGILNCGFAVNCTEFLLNYSILGEIFNCLLFDLYDRKLAAPEPLYFNVAHYVMLSLLPAMLLAVCIVYIVSRGVFSRAFPVKQGTIQSANGQAEPKSYYFRKLMELERLKQQREERERCLKYEDNVAVDQLETVTALIIRPDPSWVDRAIVFKVDQN